VARFRFSKPREGGGGKKKGRKASRRRHNNNNNDNTRTSSEFPIRGPDVPAIRTPAYRPRVDGALSLRRVRAPLSVRTRVHPHRGRPLIPSAASVPGTLSGQTTIRISMRVYSSPLLSSLLLLLLLLLLLQCARRRFVPRVRFTTGNGQVGRIRILGSRNDNNYDGTTKMQCDDGGGGKTETILPPLFRAGRLVYDNLYKANAENLRVLGRYVPYTRRRQNAYLRRREFRRLSRDRRI